MFQKIEMVKLSPVKALFNTTCDVFTNEEHKGYNGVSSFRRMEKYHQIPCYVSKTTTPATNDVASVAVHEINLYCDAEFKIPAGSEILVDGVKYKYSGHASNYKVFQKIPLVYSDEC